MISHGFFFFSNTLSVSFFVILGTGQGKCSTNWLTPVSSAFSSLIFKLHLIRYYFVVGVCVCEVTYVNVRGQLPGLGSLAPVDSSDDTRVVRLERQWLCLQNHLAGPLSFLPCLFYHQGVPVQNCIEGVRIISLPHSQF